MSFSFLNRSAKILTLCGSLSLVGGATFVAHAENSEGKDPGDLPWGVYPPLSDAVDDPEPIQDLSTEIQNLGQEVKETVKVIAERRNLRCLGGPCQVQAIPILYTHKDSGFFGGFRANLRRATPGRQSPPFSFDFMGVRSDNAQWRTYLQGTFDHVEFLPFRPRLVTQVFYDRTTETRYFGRGGASVASLDRPLSDVRYSLKEYGVQGSLLVPAFHLRGEQGSIFLLFSSAKNSPAPFSTVSKLFEDRPPGIEGGYSSSVGLGFMVDSRDDPKLATHGNDSEVSGEISGPPLGDFFFQRLTFVNRHYARLTASGNWILANRFTVDSLSGRPPFWELAGVGGLDPIRQASGSTILRGYSPGRFHERFKIFDSSEIRWILKSSKFLGKPTEWAFLPIAVDFGRMGPQYALSFSVGAMALVDRGFQALVFLSRSRDEWRATLNFGHEF